MSYHTPPGFAEAATMLDEKAQHQIQIRANSKILWVTCNCLVRRRLGQTIAVIETVEDAWREWWQFHSCTCGPDVTGEGGIDPDVLCPVHARCTCGPDLTGEAPDERPDCPQHGTGRPVRLPGETEPPF